MHPISVFRRQCRGAIVAALVALAAPAAAQGGGSVRLSVTEAESGTPIPGARATIVGTRHRATTGRDGVAHFPGVAARAYSLEITGPGRAGQTVPFEARAGEMVSVVVALSLAEYRLDGLEVEGTPQPRHPGLRGFYDRVRDDRGGRFITRSQIERMGATHFTDIFRTIAGAQIVPSDRPGYSVIRFGRHNATPGSQRCLPRYFLDGIPHPVDVPDIEIDPDDVEGVEVYPGPAIPPRYSGRYSPCGVIAVWTREEH
ncbi:MAG TPA: carboxypeptidase regulatory-like domain-containing protein [Longimicrobium sp.]|jgi:hypothetical protein